MATLITTKYYHSLSRVEAQCDPAIAMNRADFELHDGRVRWSLSVRHQEITVGTRCTRGRQLHTAFAGPT